MHEAQGFLEKEGLHRNGTVNIKDVGAVFIDLILKLIKN